MLLSPVLRRILPLVLLPIVAFSQASIRGSVTDQTTNEPLVGAHVFVQGTAIGTATDREGKYVLTGVPAGSYQLKVSYIGYVSKEISQTVESGSTLSLDITLMADVVQGEEVIVTAQARGQVAAINQQRTSNTIINVISEEKIQELPDANAAEAIGRLPGVSLIRSGGEANKVLLRGLSDKFSTITIDGIKVPPTDANERGVDLSTISQGTLAGVELFKALTPDKDADAIAGSINLVTKRAPQERVLKADLKGDYNHLMKALDQYDVQLKYGERFFD
ncbi:MAG: carboxypeptidase-like regulatory domain-containing protein, partial [Bacteroidetes bacterium]|nr:carboxypeptidase-like regulatory domain-containing protein [Bacteroidota bacterium]